ncbi:dihydrofolate reductase family protein [Scatolibacter rhodanostii]|uniref:dihydrofolate reductase family protein n=1 Tax=Scatolibacter rhodanostii TaxID=2014781 RepID=UPI000C089138|nr:dihydrofolate reductase family protein [Scatolibacter rhodanostii]
MIQDRKIVLYIAASLDGYIATKDENLDWLFAVEGEGDNGYSSFYQTIDTILIGRTTYDWIIKQENGNFPYQGKECYVFSSTPKEDTEHVRFICKDIIPLIKDLKARNGKKIWLVGGGKLVDTFLKEKLVDEIILNIAPKLLGDGIPLFHKNDFESSLVLKQTRQFNQFIELSYEVLS